MITANDAEYTLAEGRLIAADGPREAAFDWLRRVTAAIDCYPLCYRIKLLPLIDLLTRMAYGRPAPDALLNQIFSQVFEARIHGDMTIAESDLYLAIKAGLARRDPAYLGRPLRWLSLTLAEWYSQVRLRARFNPSIPQTEANARLAILLTEDLMAFTPDPMRLKRRLLAANPSLTPPVPSHASLRQ